MAFTTKQKAYLALSATSIIWGTTWVASKIAVGGAPGLQISYLRQGLAGLILLYSLSSKVSPGLRFGNYDHCCSFLFSCSSSTTVLLHGV